MGCQRAYSLTDDQTVELGTRADALLSSATFNYTIGSLVEQYTAEMFTTAPEQQDERERLYYLHHALCDIRNRLQVWVAQKDVILAQHELEE